MTPDEFAQEFQLTKQQQAQFANYFELLIDWNQKMNLTRITAEADVYAKHFYDSLAAVKFDLIPSTPVKLLDIGAGAGFPSLPMKILCPELKVTIIDSLAKRINFLSNLTAKLDLADPELLHGRAEDFGQQSAFRGQFDFVTARAVARLNVLTELTLPFLKKGGRLLSLKAVKFDEELAEAQNAIQTLGGKFASCVDYELPDGSERHLICIKKVLDTPKKYPRQAGIPGKQPL